MKTKKKYSNGFGIPLLIIGYTRPHMIAKQLEILSLISPKKIYFYLDGPKTERDALLMNQTIKELDKITWETELKKNINSQSVGAAKAITSAITWAFLNEKNLIILEDDVLPCLEFFELCEFYLNQSLINNQVGIISGHQVETKHEKRILNSTLSIYPRIHGWATQKDVWESFDYRIKISLKEFLFVTLKLSNFNIFFFLYLCYVHYKIKRNKLDTWDYQFLYFLNLNKLTCIVPSSNLIVNLGYGETATHTRIKGVKQEFTGAGLPTMFEQIRSLKISKSGDKNWRKYRIEMLFKSLFQKILKIIKLEK